MQPCTDVMKEYIGYRDLNPFSYLLVGYLEAVWLFEELQFLVHPCWL